MKMSSNFKVTGTAIETFVLGNPDPGNMAKKYKCQKESSESEDNTLHDAKIKKKIEKTGICKNACLSQAGNFQ